MPILTSTYHNAKLFKEVSAEEMGCQNQPIQVGVSTITSNPIDVQGYNQFSLVVMVTPQMDQLSIRVDNNDDANWNPLGGGSAWLNRIVLAENMRCLNVTPYALSFGVSSNTQYSFNKDQDANAVMKNITFFFEELAPGTGGANALSAKFFMFVM